jgi:hypothetical protein
MTVEVAGLWERDWLAPLTEAELWVTAMREFGCERLNMTPVSGLHNKWIAEYPTLGHLLDDRAHLTPVLVDENGETELADFEHPDDVLYIFGKCTYSPLALAKGMSVRIDSKLPGMMWPHQAMSVVLYDRHRK